MKLDEAIVVHFDETGRAALAAGLGVDWAGLPGPTPPGATPAEQAAALVEAAARAGQAAALLAALAAARPAVPWAELAYPAATLARLHAALCRRHSLDSLRTLCFRLGLDFDDLPGETKAGRARELILALERQGRVAELLARYERRDTKYEFRKRRTPRRVRRFNSGSGVWRASRRRLRAAMASSYSYLVFRLSYLKSPLVLRLAPAVSLLSFVALWLLIMTNDGLPMTPEGQIGATGEPWLADGVAGVVGIASATPTPAAPAANSATPPLTVGEWVVSLSPLLPFSPAPSLPRSGAPRPPFSPSPQAAAALPTVEKEHVATRPETPAVVLVGERGANVRRGPGAQYAVVVTLRAGARLALRAVSPTGEWVQVRLPGHGSPWIDAGYVTIIGGVGGKPVGEVTSGELRVTSEESAATDTMSDAPVAWAGDSAGAPASPPASPAPSPTAAAATPLPPASPTPRPTVMPTQTPPRPTVAPTAPPP